MKLNLGTFLLFMFMFMFMKYNFHESSEGDEARWNFFLPHRTSLLLSWSVKIWWLAFCDFPTFVPPFHFHLTLLFPLLYCSCSADFMIVPFPVASPLLWLLVLEGSYGEFFWVHKWLAFLAFFLWPLCTKLAVCIVRTLVASSSRSHISLPHCLLALGRSSWS